MKSSIEKETAEIDSLGSAVTIIRKVNGNDVNDVQKQYRIVIRVGNDAEAKQQQEHFVAKLNDLRSSGKLVIKDKDPSTIPSFMYDYPRSNSDGSFLVIKSWTERVRIN